MINGNSTSTFVPCSLSHAPTNRTTNVHHMRIPPPSPSNCTPAPPFPALFQPQQLGANPTSTSRSGCRSASTAPNQEKRGSGETRLGGQVGMAHKPPRKHKRSEILTMAGSTGFIREADVGACVAEERRGSPDSTGYLLLARPMPRSSTTRHLLLGRGASTLRSAFVPRSG